MRRRAGCALAGSLAALVAACGGGSGTPTTPDPPASGYRITIGSNGAVSPTELVVPPGTRVLFTNQHGSPHEMGSDPHPDHTLCAEINQVGLLRPGESRETGNLVTVRTCGFHDHTDPTNRSLQGRIVVR